MTQVNSNNNFSEMLFKSSLNQTNEKNQKAENQGIIALSSILSTMKSTLSSTMKGSNEEQGPSNYQVIQALSAMTSDVNHLQGTIAQVGSNEAKSSADVSETLVQAAQANQKTVENEISTQEAEMAKEKRNSLIGKIVGAVISVVVSVCTFGSGAPVMALCMLGMAALSESGALKDLSNSIATSLENNEHMSPQDAKAVADAITVVMVVAATVTAGYAGSTFLVKDAVKVAAEKGAAEVVEKATATTIKETVLAAFKTVGENNPFRMFSATTNMAIAAAFQTAQQTGAVSDAATAIMTKDGASQDQIDAVVKNINYTMDAVTVVISAATLDGGMNGLTSTTTAARFANFSETATKAFKALDVTANVVLASVKSGIDINVGALQLAHTRKSNERLKRQQHESH